MLVVDVSSCDVNNGGVEKDNLTILFRKPENDTVVHGFGVELRLSEEEFG